MNRSNLVLYIRSTRWGIELSWLARIPPILRKTFYPSPYRHDDDWIDVDGHEAQWFSGSMVTNSWEPGTMTGVTWDADDHTPLSWSVASNVLDLDDLIAIAESLEHAGDGADSDVLDSP